MMPLQKNKYYHHDPPPRMNPIDSDDLQEISDLTQRGWLAPQHETDSEDDDDEEVKRFHKPEEELKNEPNVLDAINEVFETSRSNHKNSNIGFSMKKDYESMLSYKFIDTTPELTTKPCTKNPVVPKKPIYRSIIAITAAIIIQNSWRDYRRRKLTRTSDMGSSILQIKRRIENNISFYNNSSTMQEPLEETKQHKDNNFEIIKEEIERNDDKFVYKPEIIEKPSGEKEEKVEEDDLFLEPEIKNTLYNKITQIKNDSSSKKGQSKGDIQSSSRKSSSLSPSHLKRQKVEKWVTKDESINSQKKSTKDEVKNTIDIVNTTDKTKERIKRALSKSVSKRPDIWSDYSQSYKSKKGENNISMRHNAISIINQKYQDASIHSLLLGDTNRLENESKESNNSGLFDIKMTLKSKLKDFVKSQNNKIKKEIEVSINTLSNEESKDKGQIEIVKKNTNREDKNIATETPDEKILFNPSPSPSNEKEAELSENLIDTLNSKLEEKEEEKINALPQDTGSQSDQKIKEDVKNNPKYERTLDEQIQKLGSSYSPDTPDEQLISPEKTVDNSDSFK